MLLQRYGDMVFKPYPKEPHGTYLLLAGGENRGYRELLLRNNVKGVLLSYYHIRRHLRHKSYTIDSLKEDLSRFDYVYLDSGGYTLQQQVQQKKLDVDLQRYILDYYDFCKQLEGYVTVFGAVDPVFEDYPYGAMIDHVFEARSLGIHVAPTLFYEQSWKDVEKSGFIGNFDIIGLSGGRRQRNKLTGAFAALKKYGFKVHGYAMTSQQDMRQIPFFSIDSITWLGGEKYGVTYIFKAGLVRAYDLNDKLKSRKPLKALCDANGIDYDKLLADDNDAVNALSLYSWKMMHNELKRHTERAYWLGYPANLVDEVTWECVSKVPEEDTVDGLLASLLGKQVPVEEKTVEVVDTKEVDAKEVMLPESKGGENLLDTNNEFPTSEVQRALPLVCDKCFAQDDCPNYVSGNKCSLRFRSLLDEKSVDVKQKMFNSAVDVLGLQYERIQRAGVFEKLNGGVIDPALSHEITKYFTMLKELKALGSKGSSISITATGEAAEENGILHKLLKG